MTDLSSEIDMDEFTGPKPANDKPQDASTNMLAKALQKSLKDQVINAQDKMKRYSVPKSGLNPGNRIKSSSKKDKIDSEVAKPTNPHEQN